MRFGIFLSVAVLSAAASAGVGKMDSKPLWDLADHGGPRKVSAADPLEIPNAAIPNVRAFTFEATYRFDDVTEERYFTLVDQGQSNTGWGAYATTLKTQAKPIFLKCNGETYDCSLWLWKVNAGTVQTLTVTARKGWIVVYKDGREIRNYIADITPNLEPIRIGGPSVVRGKDLGGVTLLSLKIWGEDEEYYAPGEPRDRESGCKTGKGWQVKIPTKPLKGVPNVFYYGDSISVGYTPSLTRKTKGRANLYHWMSCIYFPEPQNVVLRKFEEIGQLADYDYVVFNNGLHSLHWTADKYSDEAVAESYRTLVRAFRACAPKAKLVYLMTTPHTLKKDASGKVPGLGGKNDVVLRLNRLAGKVMAEEGVAVIDTYALLVNRLDLSRGDTLHWLDGGYELISNAIVRELGLEEAK